MYSLMMLDSCSTRSRSTSTGVRLYGLITARSSGLWSRSTSMIWKSIPFSCRTIRQRWLKGSVVPEYKVIMVVSAASVDVFPVFALQPVHQSEQQAEEQQHDNARVDAMRLRGFADVIQ